MYRETHVRVGERRRKRMVIPAIYFIAEITLFWLILSLIQLEFNIEHWEVWSIILFVIATLYSTFKTIHVYRRQKDYPEK